MLRSLKDLERYKVSATDGPLGSVVNFLLDDEHWAIRYLVVDTGGFLGGRQVLVTPISFREIDWYRRRFHLALTKDEVKNSPSIDTHKPVSRQHEAEYQDYYGYPYYWGYAGLWGAGTLPTAMASRSSPADRPLSKAAPGTASPSTDDSHLRSVNELRTYHIHGTDGSIGHVDDFIVDDVTWRLPYLVVDTSDWWLGQKVLVAPQWASRVSWVERNVYLDISRHAIEESPRWDPETPINRMYEERLYDFYGRPVYWTSPAPQAPTRGKHGSPGHP